jgi:hypothetical protein
MPLVLAGASSGSTTIQATDAVTATLTLPATTGTVVTKDTNGILSVNGIQFPATQSASADANTLDDYEEGSWTPLLQAGTANPTVTYNEQFGRYVKIGKQVTAQFYLGVDAYSGGSGVVKIGGLPFTSNADRQPTSSAGAFYVVNFQTASGHTFPSLGVISSSIQAEILIYSNNGAWAGPALSAFPTASYSAVQATLTYMTT